MDIKAKSSIQILRTTNEVFDAIISPEKMSQYFIESASAPMTENTTVEWKFPEFDDYFPVTTTKITPNSSIVFKWNPDNPNGSVTITLTPFEKNYTVIHIVENGFEKNEDSIQKALQQTEGWANFLASLKAFVEYNINLRKGAFDFYKSS